MATITVYEIRTDYITIECPHKMYDIKRFLDENVDDSAGFMGENARAIEEYESEAEALEALKAYHATVSARKGTSRYEIGVESYWVEEIEWELDEDGERDYYEAHDPIAFAPFSDEVSLRLDIESFDWNGKEWVHRVEDYEVDDEEE